LFAIIEDLVKWENSTNEEVLERARAEIRKSCGGELPPVYDPFSGGGSIPLEAQRLGLPAYGSDLNPVAVMIGKAMIEIRRSSRTTSRSIPAQGIGSSTATPKDWLKRQILWRVDA
jgi:putative DNA methylase